MSTNNAVNTTLSGQSGTGSFAGTTSPTLVTPTLGAATATSVTFNPTTGGIVGTTTNDNTATGKVGEFVSSVIASASAISISNNTQKDLTSISLTAGDWDVWGNLTFLPAATTQVTAWVAWISSTSATIPDSSLYNASATALFTPGSGSAIGKVAPSLRFSLSGTTTIYITGYSSFITSTMTFCGGIYARRRR